MEKKSEDKWKKDLTPEEYHVLREGGTEPAFSGKYYETKDKGLYKCAGCGEELFSSEAKFDSGTGWPSFSEPKNLQKVELREDQSHGMIRTEVVCKKCGGHLGHVFPDGPTKMPDGKPASGQRFCINSCALEFEKK